MLVSITSGGIRSARNEPVGRKKINFQDRSVGTAGEPLQK